MDIYAIRKQNLLALMAGKTQRSCADRWETSPSTLSQIVSKNPVRNLGDDLARKIEQAEGLPAGWFDHVHGESQPEPSRPDQSTDNPHKEGTVHAVDFRQPRLREFEIDIPQYDVRAAMGAGQVPPEYVELVRHVVVDKRHLDLFGVSYSAPGNLAMITGWGQSMADTINHGEPVIVDRGVDRFIGDGIYVFTWDGLIYLKRLQKEPPARLKVISDNRNHDPFYIPTSEAIIHARVVMVWNARKV